MKTCALADKADIREARNLFLVGSNVGGYTLCPGHYVGYKRRGGKERHGFYEEFAFSDDEVNEIASTLGEDPDVLRLKMGPNAAEMTLRELVAILQFIEDRSTEDNPIFQNFELGISKIDEGSDDPSQYYPAG